MNKTEIKDKRNTSTNVPVTEITYHISWALNQHVYMNCKLQAGSLVIFGSEGLNPSLRFSNNKV